MQGQQSASDTRDRKLFIGGLNHDTVEGTLQGYFQQWGDVTDCVIMKDNQGKSRGFGFITYKEPYQLQNAQRNGPHVIDNKEVDAKVAVPKDHEQLDTNREQLRKLFIGGLNYDTTVTGLQNHFGQFGQVVDCSVMKDGDGRSRGFGFVVYSEVSHLDEAQRRRPHKIDGKEVETKRAMPKDSGDNNMTVTKMFVGGLKDDTTEDMVRHVFSEFGNIEDVDILKDRSTGRLRGFCFVIFSDYDSVDRAVLRKRHDLNGFKVEVRKAVGKDQMASRGPGPRRFDGPRDGWMDGPPRNFPNGGGRYDRGGGDGYGGGGGRGGYNNNYGGPSGGGRGGYNNFGGGGGGYGGNGGGYGGNGGGGNFGNSGGDGSYGGSGFGGGNNNNQGGSGGGSNYGGGSGGSGNFGGFGMGGGGGGNYGGQGGGANNNGNFGGSGGSGGFNNNNYDGGNTSGGAGFNNNSFGGSSSGGGYQQQQQQQQQQQNWSGSGNYNYSDNNSNTWGSSSGAGLGNNYNNDYSGGPVKATGGGYSSRSQGPYGGGYGASGGSGNTSNRGSISGGGSGGTGWRG